MDIQTIRFTLGEYRFTYLTPRKGVYIAILRCLEAWRFPGRS